MLRLITAVSALALCATPVLAQTSSVVPDSSTGSLPTATVAPQAAMQPVAAAQPAPVKAAPEKVAATPVPAQVNSDKPMPEKTADAGPAPVKPVRHHHQMASAARGQRSDAVGEREVNALNVLESQGYSSFRDLKPDGKAISAVADKDGKQVQVKVTPDGQVEPSI